MTKPAILFLLTAIVMEVVATMALKASGSFTRLWPSVVTIVCYCIAFWCLTIPMKTIPTGVIYAVWSGAGMVLIGLASWLLFGQKLDFPAMLGMALIVSGVAVINLFSKTQGH